MPAFFVTRFTPAVQVETVIVRAETAEKAKIKAAALSDEAWKDCGHDSYDPKDAWLDASPIA